MATTTLLSLDEYLKTAYERDVEFVDGGLRERPVVLSAHGLLMSGACARELRCGHGFLRRVCACRMSLSITPASGRLCWSPRRSLRSK